jgi:hypothetical protein
LTLQQNLTHPRLISQIQAASATEKLKAAMAKKDLH